METKKSLSLVSAVALFALLGVAGPASAAGTMIAVSVLPSPIGTVVSKTKGLNCGLMAGTAQKCTVKARANKDVHFLFTATPIVGGTFTGWVGCPHPKGNVCKGPFETSRLIIPQFTDPVSNAEAAAKGATLTAISSTSNAIIGAAQGDVTVSSAATTVGNSLVSGVTTLNSTVITPVLAEVPVPPAVTSAMTAAGDAVGAVATEAGSAIVDTTNVVLDWLF